MSTQGDWQQSAQPAAITRRASRAVPAAIGILVFLFLLQVAYQLFFADRGYADVERMNELQALPAVASSADRRAPNAESKFGDWPQWRGPFRDGISHEVNLLAEWPAGGPPKRWEQPAGSGYSSFAIAAERVFTIMQDGDSEAVVCWDADSGNELWRYRYPARFVSRDGSGPRATPTVDGELIFTVGATGQMHCLKARPATPLGEVIWHKDLLQEFAAKNLRWGTSFSPLVEGELIYICPGGAKGNSVAALDKRTGALVWKNLDDAAGYSSPMAADIAGRRQIVFFTAAGLVGLAPDDGTLLWRFPWETSYGCNIATPIALGDYLFLSSGYGHGCAVIHVEAGTDGKLQARRVYDSPRMRNHFPSSVYYRGCLYGFDENWLTCMDFATGNVRWRQGGFGKGSLLIGDNQLIILGENGKLALAEATPDRYREKTSCQISDGQCWVVPALAAGRLYVRDDRRVMCLDLRGRGFLLGN